MFYTNTDIVAYSRKTYNLFTDLDRVPKDMHQYCELSATIYGAVLLSCPSRGFNLLRNTQKSIEMDV